MDGSVLDNQQYTCQGCGKIVGHDIAAYNKPCPRCGGHTFTQMVLTPVCDFCSEPTGEGEAHVHLAREHEVPMPEIVSRHFNNREWAACDACHALIEAGDRQGLMERAVRYMKQLHPEIPEPVLLIAVAVPHAGFWGNREE